MTSEALEVARCTIEAEARAVAQLVDQLDGPAFDRAAKMVLGAGGALLTSGVGKAGHVARKLAATFSSTGTPSHFLNAGDATHGDVGSIRKGDVLLLLSNSGRTEELVRLLSLAKKLGHPAITMTASADSDLARAADVALTIGKLDEACPLGLAPTASTTAMLALGDALAMAVMALRKFTADDFARYHPAGQLGRRLMRVEEAMGFRAGENLPVAHDELTVGAVLASVSRIKRRSGGVILVDENGVLSGFFSDGDLRRLVERDPAGALETPVGDVMTRKPKSVRVGELASAALARMREARIDELPVVDEKHVPVGLVDVQDLVMLKTFDVDQS